MARRDFALDVEAREGARRQHARPSKAQRDVRALLNETERPRIIVTSRAPLNLRAEWRLPLSGLPVPEPDEVALENYASVQLLVGTGQQVQPEFTITDDNRADIIRICRSLAGMPASIIGSAMLSALNDLIT